LNVDLSRATSLLIVKPSSLGDVVHTIPAASLIASACPHLRIQWLVNPEWAPLIDELPWLAAALPFPRSRFRGFDGVRRFSAWRHEFREQLGSPPDITLDFQGLLRSGLASRWSQAPVRMGLSDSREGARLFHTDIVAVDPNAHAVDRYLSMVRALNIEVPDELPWELPPGSPIPNDWLEGISPSQAIVLHPFSRGDGKSLTTPQIIQFCNACSDVPVILVGMSQPVSNLPDNTCDLTNRTSLPQLVWLMRRAGWIVSVDSGPMHIAAAASPRVLGIHTWSDPCKVGPYRPEAWIYKGGQIFHRGDCQPDLRSSSCQIADDDVDAIAAFATGRLKKCQG
jgi:heptosyltransferase-1